LGHILRGEERGCERLLHSIGMNTGRSKSERQAKDNLEKDAAEEGKKQGGWKSWEVAKLGGTEQEVLVGKRDGLMRLLAGRDMMMMMISIRQYGKASV